MSIKFANNASSLLAAPIVADDVTLTVTEADAALFPTLGVGDYVYVTLEDRRVVPNLREIVKCTARSENVLTIIRAQDGTAGQNFFMGAVVSARLTRAALLAFLQEEIDRAMAAEAAEAAARAAADTAETAARIAADLAETAARIAADGVLQDAIDAEITARTNADATEAAARAAADAAEAAARAAADATNAASIAAEYAARVANVIALEAAINAEIARAEAAEAALDGRVTTLEGAPAPTTTGTLAGAAHTDGSGFFSVTFTPPFASTLTFFAVSYGDGSVYPFTPAFFLTVLGSPSGMSAQALDYVSGLPLPNLDIFWTAAGF